MLVQLGLLCGNMIFHQLGALGFLEVWLRKGNEKQPAAFENQGPKYVKVYFLIISFLLLDQVSTQSSGCRAVVFALCHHTVALGGRSCDRSCG